MIGESLPKRALFAAAFTLVACGAGLVAHYGDIAVLPIVMKMTASLSFLATAWLAGARHSVYGRVLFVGLICSSWGDYFLLSATPRRFLAGLISFFLAHVTYCVAYVLCKPRIKTTSAAGATLAVAGIFVVRWVWPHVPDDMHIPVAAYITVISIMVALAAGTASRSGGRFILVGAVLFYLSDLFVARQQFVTPGFVNSLVGLPLYFGGQVVLALSIAWVNRGKTTAEDTLPDHK